MLQSIPIAASAGATVVLVKAVAGQRVYVKGLSITGAVSDTGTFQLQDTNGVALTGVMTVNGSITWPLDSSSSSNDGWVATAIGAGLQSVQATASTAGVICVIQQ